MAEPRASRPRFPRVYGVPEHAEELLPWSWLEARMREAMHYWLVTVRPDGIPHARPVDGMWLDGAVYFGGSPDSKWWRNLLMNSSASIHLEDAVQALILEGRVEFVKASDALAARLADESNRKYAMGQSAADYKLVDLASFRPRRALGWDVLNRDATRWTLE